MEKEFVPYAEALALKELGFDEPCFAFYSKIYGFMTTSPTNKVNEFAGEVILPLYQQAFRWFRENYNLLYNINETYEKSSKYIYSIGYGWSDALESYEEAELECLKKLIEIVKTK